MFLGSNHQTAGDDPAVAMDIFNAVFSKLKSQQEGIQEGIREV